MCSRPYRWFASLPTLLACLLFFEGAVTVLFPIKASAADSPKIRSKSSKTAPSEPEPDPGILQKVAQTARSSVVVISHFGREGKSDGVGSGFVVSPNGLIATSLHVIGEGRPVQITTADGSRLEVVEVYSWDRKNDLAVLKVKGKIPAAFILGDSDSLRLGDELLAIGNPMGLDFSVVRGVMSARREVEGTDMLQVAIPIEPGNSGGPLVNPKGEVVGIMALKSVVTANLGFAVPVNALKALLDRPSPMPVDKWLNVGALNAAEWEAVGGARWRQRVDRIVVEGVGDGFGGRSLCLAKTATVEVPYALEVWVKLNDESGAAGLAFGADGSDKHYGFYPTGGQLRLTRFDGPNVYSWTILEQGPSDYYRKGGWNRIGVQVDTNQVRCFVNGRVVFQTSDPAFAGNRVGLCKFRDTEAEFKGLKWGRDLPQNDAVVQDSLNVRIQEYLARPEKEQAESLIRSMEGTPTQSRQWLSDRALQLERNAAELRKVADLAHARRTQSELKNVLTAGESEIDLVHAALLLSQYDDPELDVEAYRKHVDRMAAELKTEIKPGADDATKLSALKHYFFTEQGFHGSRQDYYDKANSYLNQVAEYREGIPITLSVLFIELGHRIGLTGLRGHPLPGHFVVLYHPTSGLDQIIDVYEGGRGLSHAEADLLASRYSDGGTKSELLEPATKRDIIVRMIRNLQQIARGDESTPSQLRYLDLILVLQPSSPLDRLDRARLRAQIHDSAGAREDIQWLLDHSPPGVDPDRLEDLLKELK